VTILDVLDTICDTEGLDIFYSIASDRINTRNLKMSRRQYYLRLSKMIKANMIKRKRGKYLLTPFGKVIYGAHLEFVKAIDEHFKSKIHYLYFL
jgi:predicted transcriptional regulator